MKKTFSTGELVNDRTSPFASMSSRPPHNSRRMKLMSKPLGHTMRRSRSLVSSQARMICSLPVPAPCRSARCASADGAGTGGAGGGTGVASRGWTAGVGHISRRCPASAVRRDSSDRKTPSCATASRSPSAKSSWPGARRHCAGVTRSKPNGSNKSSNTARIGTSNDAPIAGHSHRREGVAASSGEGGGGKIAIGCARPAEPAPVSTTSSPRPPLRTCAHATSTGWPATT